MGGEANETDRLLTKLTDPSAINYGNNTFELFSASVPTGQTITGPHIFVGMGGKYSCLIDVTGAGATGVVCTLRGGISGFVSFQALRVLTASAGNPGTYLFSIFASNEVSSGHSVSITGSASFQDICLQVRNPTSVTGGASVSVRAVIMIGNYR